MTVLYPAPALRDLLRGWQSYVDSDRDTPDEYRAQVRRVVTAALEALEKGLTPYEVMIFGVAPVFAAADEETVEVVWPDDRAEDAA